MPNVYWVRRAFAFAAMLLGLAGAHAADALQLKPSPRTIADISAMLDQYKPDPKRADEIRAILDSKPPETTDRKELARFYWKRGEVAREIGAAQRQIDDFKKAVDLGGVDDLVSERSRLVGAQAHFGNAALAVESLLQYKSTIPPGRGQNAVVQWLLVHAYLTLGDVQKAQEALQSAENNIREFGRARWWPDWQYYYAANIEWARARVLRAQGKVAEVEVALQRALEAREADIQMARLRKNRETNEPTEKEYQFYAENSRAQLAYGYLLQGRLTDAEAIARQALARVGPLFGGYSMQMATVLQPFIYVLTAQGRYAEARLLSEKVLDISFKSGAVNDSRVVQHSRQMLAAAATAQGDYPGALRVFQETYDAHAAFPDQQVDLARGNIDWALALVMTGKPDDSLAMLGRLIPHSRQWLGDKNLETANLIGVKAMALAAKGDKAGALAEFRIALPVVLAAAISEGDEPSPMVTNRLRIILEAFLALLADIRGTPTEASTGIDAAGESFRIADALRSQKTQGAVAASASRAAANDPAIGAEIRKEQDLAQESSALQRILRDLMNAPAEKQLSKTIGDMKARIETIKTERAAIQAGIEKRFPAYANLIRPQPPTLAETRAVLRPDEALINIFATDSATYLWAFKKDGPVAFASTKVNRDELTKRVQVLRKALDLGDADLTKGIPDFDLDAAHRLYTDLLAPVSAGWSGATHLLVAANGALSQLPLALLPTQKVAVKADPKLPYGQFKDVPWLLRQAAFTQLPSVNALVALRKLPAASAERAAFVGFGDPQFSETPIQVASSRGRLRNLNIARPSLRDLEQGKAVEWMDYGKIPPLPDTRDEILALAQALKANPEADVFLGSKASKENLKKLDLSKRKVVAFATHGLLAGDFPGVSEPSLALANPGGGKHGLLTLEDILGLKLDADWVVLSACNTAGGDGEGADALSGLGRGFFYAGSRALLVTHWPVESVSAKTLVTGIFERQAADPKLSRAEALRQSMLALMQSKSSDSAFAYAHPLFWAPYALVGEGGI